MTRNEKLVISAARNLVKAICNKCNKREACKKLLRYGNLITMCWFRHSEPSGEMPILHRAIRRIEKEKP